MNEQIPTDKPLYFLAHGVDDTMHVGVTQVGQITTSGQPELVSAESKEELMELTKDLDWSGYNPLPLLGDPCIAGHTYTDGNQLVVCRQDHNRTEHSVGDIPALFLIYRENSDGAEWIAGEHVNLSEERTHNGKTWIVLQGHQTQTGWEPDNTPALWSEVIPETGGIPDWVQPTGGHDAYNINDEVMFELVHYRSLIGANVWSPTAYPAGWEEV